MLRPYDLEGITMLAIDPGKMTGIAAYDSKSGALGVCEKDVEGTGPDWSYDYLFSLIERFTPSYIVCESFRITANTAKNTQAPWSLELIGVARLAAGIHGSNFQLQAPGDAKGFSTDAKLRALGWYNPSKGGHQNDATRHLLAMLVKRGWWDDRLAEG